MAQNRTCTMCNPYSIVQVSLLLVLAFHLSVCSAILTIPEKEALQQIYENHPDLSSVPSWAVLDSNGQYFGHSWNDSFDNLCAVDGFEIYGVYCQDGHVGGLYVYGIVNFCLNRFLSS